MDKKLRKLLKTVTLAQEKFTSSSYSTLPSMPEFPKEYQKRWKDIMRDLIKLNKECPVLMAQGYNNGAYMSDLDSVFITISRSTGHSLEYIATEWSKMYGINPQELLRKLGPDIVIIGEDLFNPMTLAHEFGHYRCTRNLHTEESRRAHMNYASGGSSAQNMRSLGDLSHIIGWILHFLTVKMSLGISLLIASLLRAISLIPASSVIKAEKAANDVGKLLLESTGKMTDEDWVIYIKTRKAALDTYLSYYKYKPLKWSAIEGILGATLTYFKV